MQEKLKYFLLYYFSMLGFLQESLYRSDGRFVCHSLNSEATGYAGENLKGSTVTARACLMGANLIDAGGL